MPRRGSRATWPRPTVRTAPALSTRTTSRSSSTTTSYGSRSNAASSSSTPDSATVCARWDSARRRAGNRSRQSDPPTVADATSFAAEYSALYEADLGLAFGLEGGRAGAACCGARAPPSVRSALPAEWQTMRTGVGATRRVRADETGGRDALRDRVRRLLDRVAWLADGEGARHVGLPRVLPAALRLGASALRAPALSHSPDASRARDSARPRRPGAPRRRLRGCSTRLRSSPGARPR